MPARMPNLGWNRLGLALLVCRNVSYNVMHLDLAQAINPEIGRLPFLASLIATALPTTKGGGVTAVQFHAGHVQEKPITVQNDAPHLLPFTISRPLAEMPMHSFIMQHPLCEERWDRKHMPLAACFLLVENALNDFHQVTFWDIPTFCHRQMRQNFRFYRIFVQYFLHERSVYLGLASQR